MKKLMIPVAGIVASILLICFTFGIWDRVQYGEKMKNFTPQQTITEYYQWFDRCNMRRIRQMETVRGRVSRDYVNDYEFVKVINIREVDDFDIADWLAVEKWYEIKKFCVDCSFKLKENPYVENGVWQFYLVKKSVDSPWKIREFYTKG